jgi:hypothetical protein
MAFFLELPTWFFNSTETTLSGDAIPKLGETGQKDREHAVTWPAGCLLASGEGELANVTQGRLRRRITGG